MMIPVPPIAVLILAAGQSRRMRGADKMLEDVRGQPLIRRQARVALDSGMSVWVALAPDQPLRHAALADLPVKIVRVNDAADGLSRSIAAGNTAIPVKYGLILWLGDLPEVDAKDLRTVLDAVRASAGSIVRATTAAGKPGHPVYLPPNLRHELADLQGDEGARGLLRQHAAQTVFVALPRNHALTDLDTPEDWHSWRLQTQDRTG